MCLCSQYRGRMWSHLECVKRAMSLLVLVSRTSPSKMPRTAWSLRSPIRREGGRARCHHIARKAGGGPNSGRNSCPFEEADIASWAVHLGQRRAEVVLRDDCQPIGDKLKSRSGSSECELGWRRGSVLAAVRFSLVPDASVMSALRALCQNALTFSRSSLRPMAFGTAGATPAVD